jgi:lipopolysaccharide transport protein LptA
VKFFCFIALLVVAGSLNLRAQTNSTAAPRAPTRIDSDSVDFDLSTHQAVYHGDVRVDDPQMKLRCAHLVVYLPESGGRPDRIVATTNVVIDFTDEKNQTMHATSDKAVYVYIVQGMTTNETVTLTGNAKVENAQGWLTGEPIVWDRAGNHLTATNQKMIFRQNLDGMPPTNSERTKTNLSLPKSSDAAPGVIKNIDRLF